MMMMMMCHLPAPFFKSWMVGVRSSIIKNNRSILLYHGYFTGYLTEFSLCFTPCISMTKWNIQLNRGSKDRYLKELSKEYNIVTLIFELS